MTDEVFVGRVEERVHLSQRICVVHDEHQLGVHARPSGRSGNHVPCENLTQVPNVEFTAWRDARSDDVRFPALGESLSHHVTPVHGETSNGDGADQATERDIVDFVPCGFVDQHDGERDFSACGSNGLDCF